MRAESGRFEPEISVRLGSINSQGRLGAMAKIGTQIAPARASRNFLTIDPLREMMDLQRTINQLFNTGKTAGDDVALSAWTPAVDIFEGENEYIIKLELPEVSRDDVT